MTWTLSKKLVRDARTARLAEVVVLEASRPDYEVATLTLSLPSVPGLGIQLVELAGEQVVSYGQSGQLATVLVLVDELIEGGNAWLRLGDAAAIAALGSIIPGDTIVAVGSGRAGDPATTEVECASYDATVGAIRAACAAAAVRGDGEVVLVVKRLVRRRKALITATLPDGEERVVAAYDGENLRMCMLRAGIGAINDGESARYDGKGSGNCGGNGLCCTCVVSVMAGAEYLNERTTSEKQLLRKVSRWRQSCRSRVQIAGEVGAEDVAISLKLSPRSVNAALSDASAVK